MNSVEIVSSGEDSSTIDCARPEVAKLAMTAQDHSSDVFIASGHPNERRSLGRRSGIPLIIACEPRKCTPRARGNWFAGRRLAGKPAACARAVGLPSLNLVAGSPHCFHLEE